MRVETDRWRLSGGLPLECGVHLPQVELAYETYGALNQDRSNAVLVCHGLTATEHAAGRRRADDARAGWWDAAIGPGKAIDTARWYVISSNVIGGSASTGPASIDPATGQHYGMRFPVVTVRDMVAAQAQLVAHLGVTRLHAAIGGCFGGFQVLTWMALFPERLARAVVISATARVAAYTIALWKVMRDALRLDPAWRGGDYYAHGVPERGLQLMARIGALIWIEKAMLEERFANRLADGVSSPRFGFEPDSAVEALFERIGQGDVRHLDPNALMYLMRAMDYFDLTRGKTSLSEAFAASSPVRTLLLSYSSDWRYSPQEMDKIHQALMRSDWPSMHRTLDSDFGHGAFIRDVEGVGAAIRDFLADTP